jgi:hypothetical protein
MGMAFSRLVRYCFLAVHTLVSIRLREFAFILKRFEEMNVNSWMIFDLRKPFWSGQPAL